VAIYGRSHFVVCLFAIFAIGCHRTPAPPSSTPAIERSESKGGEKVSTDSMIPAAPEQVRFITAAGEHSFFGNDLRIKVYLETGRLKHSIIRKFQGKEGSISTNTELGKEKGWFIYPESADSVWLFDGVNGLTRVRFAEVDGISETYAGYHSLPGSEALKDVPQAVIDRLPESLRTEPKDKWNTRRTRRCTRAEMAFGFYRKSTSPCAISAG
jgi:hypothetical protein